jgi:HTH-type transcriptional regulator/antitoxin HigA
MDVELIAEDNRGLAVLDIPSFAERIGVAPAIVVGRLQHDGAMPFNKGNEVRRRLAFTSES